MQYVVKWHHQKSKVVVKGGLGGRIDYDEILQHMVKWHHLQASNVVVMFPLLLLLKNFRLGWMKNHSALNKVKTILHMKIFMKIMDPALTTAIFELSRVIKGNSQLLPPLA